VKKPLKDGLSRSKPIEKICGIKSLPLTTLLKA